MKINRYGFTLAEMLLVLVILGILMGIGMGGADRMDPGARGLQRMLQSFVQSSRDRARATGQGVYCRRVCRLPFNISLASSHMMLWGILESNHGRS